MDRLSDDTASDAPESTEEPEALPGDGRREGVIDELRRRIGDRLIDTHIVPNTDLTVRVATDAWAETAAALKSAGFTWFSFLSAIDWMPSPYGKGEDDPAVESEPVDTTITQGTCGGETRLQVFARLTDLRRHVGITVKADVDDEVPVVDSWTGSFAGANWHERECHEMFGIGFNHHPDLRHMYLPGDFEGYPLRKDFPLLARMVKPWPGIVDVEPMPAKAEEIKDEPLPVTDDEGDIDVEATAEILPDDAPPPDPDATTAVAAATGEEATDAGFADADDESDPESSAAEAGADSESSADDTASSDDAEAATDDAEAGDAGVDTAGDAEAAAVDGGSADSEASDADSGSGDGDATNSDDAEASDADSEGGDADATESAGAAAAGDTDAAEETGTSAAPEAADSDDGDADDAGQDDEKGDAS